MFYIIHQIQAKRCAQLKTIFYVKRILTIKTEFKLQKGQVRIALTQRGEH